MTDSGTRANHHRLHYGIIAALCVVIAAGSLFIFKGVDRSAGRPPVTVAIPVAPAAEPALPPAAAPPPAAVRTRFSAIQIEQALAQIDEARHQAARGDFDDAEEALRKAERIAPRYVETALARQEITILRTARGQLEPLITGVHRAVEREDWISAHRSLGEAEQIDALSSEVIETRRFLHAAERKDSRVTTLVTMARAATLRGDLRAANATLDQAELLNPRDPGMIEARAELEAARSTSPPFN